MIRRRLGTAVLATALIATLAGCGQAPWEVAGVTASPTRAATATPTAVPTPVPNDLSGGATQRTLQAGAVAATIDYWSDLSMERWTADALKPVSLSMITTVTPADGQKVYLQRAVMVAVPSGPDGAGDALAPQTDTATVSPGYLVISPYSYSQTFTVGAVPAGTTQVELQFSYDYLVQTTPTSAEYAKQTATDSMVIAIAGEPASE